MANLRSAIVLNPFPPVTVITPLLIFIYTLLPELQTGEAGNLKNVFFGNLGAFYRKVLPLL